MEREGRGRKGREKCLKMLESFYEVFYHTYSSKVVFFLMKTFKNIVALPYYYFQLNDIGLSIYKIKHN